MKKKFLTLILAFAAVVSCAFGFSACAGANPPASSSTPTFGGSSSSDSGNNSGGSSSSDSGNNNGGSSSSDSGNNGGDSSNPIESGISFNTLTVDGTNVYGKVSNSVTEFSFINEVTVKGSVKYVVALDKNGIQTVLTKTIDLSVGDNTVYVFEMNDDEVVKTYTVTIRRLPMYVVTFNTSGGVEIEGQIVEEGSLATMPKDPTRDGYAFKGWDYDFSKPITANVEITANWSLVVSHTYKYDGTHVYTAPDTNDYLVKNGKTDYILVVPEESSYRERTARTEFVDLFRDATDIVIKVKTDEEITDASTGKYISLGRTKLLEQAGIEIDYKTLDNDGHRIVTKGDDIYLCGGADEGTVFAVYTFMNITFNYETYYFDCMEIEHTSEKKLKAYDVTDIPDFKFRAHSSDVTMYESTDYDENMFAWRLKYYGKEGTRGYYWTPIHEVWWNMSEGGTGASTNIDRWFPEYIYNNPDEPTVTLPDGTERKVYYPKWYSTMGGGQVCFSAHGDPEAYEAMVNEAFEKVRAHLAYYTPDRYPDYKVYSMTHMDNTNYCRCWKCRELSSYYGDSQAAIQVIFMNDLAEKVDEWMEYGKEIGAEWYREDFHLLFFAYNHNFTAPAKYNAKTKQYEPIDDHVKVSDRLIVWFCREADGQKTFDSDENENCLNQLDGWSACANNIYYWDYRTNFNNYLFPIDTFQYATPEMYAYFCSKSDRYWFAQLQDSNIGPNTAWHNLKVYLEAKLAWDTSLDMDELINNWFKAMYKEAAPAMLRVFYSVRAYQQYLLVGNLELGLQTDGSVSIDRPEYWPIGVVQGWLDGMDEAKEAVAHYAVTNPELYDQICGHIETEAISNLYIILEMHGYSISAKQRQEYIDRLWYDIDWLHLENLCMNSGEMMFTGWLSGL